MFEIISFSIYTIVFGLLIIKIIMLNKTNKILEQTAVQCFIDKEVYVDQLAKEIEKRENTNVENTDGFLNFVSQSRDWAYEYIENAQQGISTFIKEVEEIKKSGATPKVALGKITKATEILKHLLPENKEK